MPTESAPVSVPEEEPTEAGKVGELRELSFEERKHRAETARSLAQWLMVILGGSVALHYILTTVLIAVGKDEGVKTRGTIFNAWRSAISSRLSAAVTYYFTREKSTRVRPSVRPGRAHRRVFSGRSTQENRSRDVKIADGPLVRMMDGPGTGM